MPPDLPSTPLTESINKELIELWRLVDGGWAALAQDAGVAEEVIPRYPGDPLPEWEDVNKILYTVRREERYKKRGQWHRRWKEARQSQHDALQPQEGGLRRLARRAAVAVAVIALLAGGVGAAVRFLPALGAGPPPPALDSHADECFPDVVRRGSECVGITDGGYAFDPALGLAPILGEIKQENDRVYADARLSVSLAYVVALPHDASDPTEVETVRSELRGAAVAQRRMNQQSPADTMTVPQIRLLVANVGDHGGLSDLVAPMLEEQTRLPNRLVAVAGLGDDGPSTRNLITRLSRSGIPMYASRLSQESVSTGGVGRIYRPAPTPAAQARAAVSSLDPGTVLEVRDVSGLDTYGQDLGNAITGQLSTRPDVRPTETKSFTGGPEAATAFQQMQDRICQVRPRTVLFSGRGRDLLAFLLELDSTVQRCWNGDRVTVLTGDEGAVASTALRIGAADGDRGAAATLSGGGVTLRFTPSAHPDQWAGRPRPETAPFTGASCPFCLAVLFPRAPVDDVTLRAYDSVLVPASSLRRAIGVQPELARPYRLTPQVLNQLALGVDETAPVETAGGPVAFDSVGHLVGRTPPVVDVDPRGGTRTVRGGSA